MCRCHLECGRTFASQIQPSLTDCCTLRKISFNNKPVCTHAPAAQDSMLGTSGLQILIRVVAWVTWRSLRYALPIMDLGSLTSPAYSRLGLFVYCNFKSKNVRTLARPCSSRLVDECSSCSSEMRSVLSSSSVAREGLSCRLRCHANLL